MKKWGWLFGKKAKEEKVEYQKPEYQKPEYQKPVYQKPVYHFQFVLTDEAVQQRIIDFITPIKDVWDVENLQLSYGVLETETGLFLTRVKSSRGKTHNGADYSATNFVVLYKEESFGASYVINNSKGQETLAYDIPEGYEEILKQAFDFWRDRAGHKAFEDELKSKGISLLDINAKLRKPLFKKASQMEKNVKKQHFEICSAEDAKKLFYLCNTDCYRQMKNSYDDETIREFKKYADSAQKKQWVREECAALLDGIIGGDTEPLYEKLRTFSSRFANWFSASDDDMADTYTRACRTLYDAGADVPIACVNSYLSHFTNKFNPLHIAGLLDITEQYLKEHFPEEYENGDFTSAAQEFKRLCAQLRGRIAELTPAKNEHDFHFAEALPEVISHIAAWYQKKYNDMEAVKEELAFLNCAYGAENDELFLTAASEAADSLHDHSWDMYAFIAVRRSAGEVIDFRCKRGEPDGALVMDYISEDAAPEVEILLLDAAAFYRNKAARETFFEEYAKAHHGADIRALCKEKHRTLFASLGKTYEAQRQRIGDNPIAETLEKLVSLCEERACENGCKNTVIRQPASDREISEWEQAHGITLPESYKHFLRFADGVQLLSGSERIFGLKEIRTDEEFCGGDYIVIGTMIGDGTTLCLSRTTGQAYIEDHGDMRAYGDFSEMLDKELDSL